MQSEEPYPGLTCQGCTPVETLGERGVFSRALAQVLHGCRQLVS
jgi:hypothetical protein